MGSVKLKDLKAYVRYDGSGRVVAGSLVFRKKKPKNGRWVEIPKNLCCDGPNPSSSTTTTTNGGGVTPTAWIFTGGSSTFEACNNPFSTVVLYTLTSTLSIGTQLYADAACTIPNNQEAVYANSGYAYTVENGIIIAITTCVTPGSCPTLGRAGNFSVLAGSTITNTGSSYITKDLGLYPGTSVTGFPPGIVTGTQHITDTAAQNAKTDATNAYYALSGLSSTGSVGADIGGTTVTPGIYSVSSSLAITGVLTLDGGGNSNAVFIFQIPSTFTAAVGSSINLTNGAQDGNIYWVVGSSATLGVGSSMYGNIIAQASITVDTSAGLNGRAFALAGAVTLDSNGINSNGATCTVNPIA